MLTNAMGETVQECAHRLMREERNHGMGDESPRLLACDRATRLALSPMARRDGTAEFYAAVASFLSDA